MRQPNEIAPYFTDKETPLPMHMMLVQMMPRPKYACRSYSSTAARALQYECFPFYKHISRVVSAEFNQEKEK
jgi:hypothetical protein